MFSVVLVFSMLSLGRILISVTILLMHVFTSRQYDSTLLGHTFFTPKVFLDELYIYLEVKLLKFIDVLKLLCDL